MSDLKTMKVQINYNNFRMTFFLCHLSRKICHICLSNQGYFCELLLLLHYTERRPRTAARQTEAKH